jgi:hypothetical protein
MYPSNLEALQRMRNFLRRCNETAPWALKCLEMMRVAYLLAKLPNRCSIKRRDGYWKFEIWDAASKAPSYVTSGRVFSEGAQRLLKAMNLLDKAEEEAISPCGCSFYKESAHGSD